MCFSQPTGVPTSAMFPSFLPALGTVPSSYAQLGSGLVPPYAYNACMQMMMPSIAPWQFIQPQFASTLPLFGAPFGQPFAALDTLLPVATSAVSVPGPPPLVCMQTDRPHQAADTKATNSALNTASSSQIQANIPFLPTISIVQGEVHERTITATHRNRETTFVLDSAITVNEFLLLLSKSSALFPTPAELWNDVIGAIHGSKRRKSNVADVLDVPEFSQTPQIVVLTKRPPAAVHRSLCRFNLDDALMYGDEATRLFVLKPDLTEVFVYTMCPLGPLPSERGPHFRLALSNGRCNYHNRKGGPDDKGAEIQGSTD